MSRPARLLASLALACLALTSLVFTTPVTARAAPPAAEPATPTTVLATSPANDWTDIAPADLLVIDLAGGGRVTILLADDFAPAHLANIRALARDHWYDGLAIERVQDDYVTQWGDPDGKKPLPADVRASVPAEYERSASGLAFRPVPDRDAYAPAVGVSTAFPVAADGGRAWLAHCYGMAGVGRDLNPDTGSGAELYAVIGQPIRALDRNIALVGRVVGGMEALSALPRGTGHLGFYTDPAQRLKIRQVRLASDLPADEQPHVQALRPESATYAAWLHVRANRQDSFFLRPAGAVDLCNAMPPVRMRP